MKLHPMLVILINDGVINNNQDEVNLTAADMVCMKEHRVLIQREQIYCILYY